MKKEKQYIILLVFAYFVISLVGILHHELWLDESHHWLISRDSTNLKELINTTRPEGHPILWNLMLYGISRFTVDIFWMQLLHILISTATVFVFLKKAPFPWVFKILFIFGYFMLFEYNLISRNYILGIFFLFSAMALFNERNKKFILLSTFLALAANVHLMFSVISLSIMLTICIENYLNKRPPERQHVIGYLIFIIGAMILSLQIATTKSGWFFEMLGQIPLSERISKGFMSLFKGMLLIPDFRTLHFWNSNLLVNLSRNGSALLGLLIYLLPLFLFFRSRKTMFFVYLALIGTQVFFFITQRSATRFHGMTYIILICGLWMQYYFSEAGSFDKNRWNPVRKAVIYMILVIHLFSGITAYLLDVFHPFNSAKQTVGYLKEHQLADLPVMSLTCEATPLSSYLERKIWFLCDGGYESYCHWDFRCASGLKQGQVRQLITGFMISHDHAVYISYFPPINHPNKNVWYALAKNIRIRYLYQSTGNSICKDQYYIFEVQNRTKIK